MMDLNALFRVVPLYMLVSIRFLGIIFTAPVFLASSFPIPCLYFLSFFFALITVPQLGGGLPEVLFSGVLPFLLAALRELLVGASIAFLASAPFYALQIAGRMIGTRMGLAMVSVLDPISQSQDSIIGQLQILIGLWFFLYWNGHILLVRALMESFRLLPLGEMGLAVSSDLGLAEWLGKLFVMAFKFAIPFYGALLLADIGLGFLARTVPQMNVFILGLPLKIGLGLFLLMVVLPMTVDIMHDQIEPYLRAALGSLAVWR
ncbi:type III secretion system inner membrane R protein [Dethiosulfovibrio peptidovorans DSM 11002]|jgi:flagellar biosynthetic protein FliR|uniref:Type III secretion system inner membrane R protein n=2 Tax=Dethiosulfovibrio TaxID=47054 RepID=D2Z3K3_9BACT|nr:type III secretion system inner membrane R protein [Dethiosulfovibrio peptidovorans DSM 11002]